MEGKKIICMIESLGPGGAERQITYLAKLLQEKQYDVQVWTYYPINFYEKEYEKYNLVFRYVPFSRYKCLRIFILLNQLKKYSPDVVVGYLNTCTSILCLFKKLGLKALLIVSERNTTQKLKLRDKIKFFLYRYSDYIVPNSYSQHKFIQTHYPFLNDKLRVITNYVDMKNFQSVSVPKKYNDSKLTMLVVGRVVAQKNVLLFLSAIKNVLSKNKNIRVRWIGSFSNQKYYFEVMKQVKILDLESTITFKDANKNILNEYHQADVFCLPSIYEGFSNAICEAMCCGLPILCGNVGDNSYLVKENRNGFLFDPYSLASMSDAIVKFLSLPIEKKSQMAMESRHIAEQLFSSDSFVASYEHLWNNREV